MQKRKLKANERDARELELVNLIGKATNPAEKTAYYDELFTSLRPMMFKIFSRVGLPNDYDDLWQEMYFALTDAVEAYLNPEMAEGVAFIAIAMTRFHQYACRFYRRFYGTQRKRKPPLSLNAPVKSKFGGAPIDMVEALEDPVDDYEKVLDRLHTKEKVKFNKQLWAEVEKLPPKQAAAIKERFIDGRKAEGHIISPADMAFLKQVNMGLEKLRRNSNVRHIARVYDVLQDSSMAYSGSFKSFKENMMSSVERSVILQEEINEREAERKSAREAREAAKRAEAEKYACRSDSRRFALRDASFLVGENLNQLEKKSGISRKTWSKWRNGGSSWFLVCKKGAEYYGRDVYEMFVDVTPKIHPNKACCFRLTDTSMLFSAGKDPIGKEIGVSGKMIANLRDGKVVTREIGEKLAVWAGRPFDELFKPITDA